MVDRASSSYGTFGRPKKIVKCAGLGGNPSSVSKKKAAANPKKPTTDIFKAQT